MKTSSISIPSARWRFVLYLLLSSLLGLTTGTAQAQTIRYVKPTASGTGNGTSWANASGNLQGMINASASGDQVWVTTGTYKPTTTTGPGSRTISFAMKEGVAIYGGFVGNETSLSQRPRINPVAGQPSSSTLSGDIGAVGDNSDNSYHVIANYNSFGVRLTNKAVLDGFVLTSGNANGGNYNAGEPFGGAITNISDSPSIVNCSFVSNSATFGGGVHNLDCTSILTNCSFIANSAGSLGGAMYNSTTSRTTSATGGRPTLVNCSLQANSATSGGAIANQACSPSLINCSLQANRASYNGGGIDNSNSSSPSLTNCSLQANSADERGGGIANSKSSPSLINCSLQNNSGRYRGGGMYSDDVSTPTLVNCSLQANSSFFGGAIANNFSSSSKVTNCVVWGNGGGGTIYNERNSTLTATYSLFDAGVTGYTGSNNLTTTTSPFVSATSVALNACTSAINAGSNQAYTAAGGPSTDLVGNPRVFGGTIDMGAVEFQSASSGNPTRLYVRANAGGANTGLSWADAFTDLQAALNFGCSQNLTQIWVAGGTYKPTGTPAAPGTDRTVSFVMKNGVAIYGGFAGTETSLSQRPAITLTTPSSSTLSGAIGATGNTDNSYHVINNSNNGLNSTAILDGVVITGGNANGSFPNNVGGGVYNDHSSPTLTNCSFQANAASSAGGGLYDDSSSPTLTNSSFQANSGPQGGAVYNADNSSPTLTNCNLQGNSATSGGAIFNTTLSNPVLTNCSLLGNSSAGAGGAVYNAFSSPTLINCSLQGNTAATSGGAMANYGSAFVNSRPVLTNCAVFGNGGNNSFVNDNNSSVTATYCLFDASVTGVDVSGAGNLTTTTSPFVSPTSVALNGCALAINAGNNAANKTSTDLGGNPRIFPTGGVIDMGAVEFQGTPNTTAFTRQPELGSTVCPGPGTTVTASVSTSGTVSGYQWYKDGGLVSEQTSATLSLTNVQPTDAGSYRVAVTGTCNSLTSTAFSLGLIPSASIQQQPPAGSVVLIGDNVQVPVGISGTATGYQWYKDGGLVSEQTSATLSLTNVQRTDAGNYVLVAANSPCNSVTTTTFNLGVRARPARVLGTKTVTGDFTPGGTVTYTIVLANSGAGDQPDAAGREFIDVLDPAVVLVSATATSGQVRVIDETSMEWNGSILAGGQVTITISARILTFPGIVGERVVNQAGYRYDTDGDGVNDLSRLTDDPTTSAPTDATVFYVVPPLVIGGTVFEDSNGLTDNTVNGTPLSSLKGNTFYATLVGAAGTVVASTSLTSGAYSFTGVTPNAAYSVILSNYAGTVGAPPPSTTLTGGVVNTGEVVGSGPGSDGTPNGVVSLTVTTLDQPGVNFGVKALPDLTPILYARPSTVYGTSGMSVVVDVVELNSVATTGPITVKISKDARLSLSLTPGATTLNGRRVQNSAWTLSGPSGGFYTLTSQQAIGAGEVLSFGLEGSLSPGASSGVVSLSVVVVGGSGGEVNVLNNNGASKIEYFSQ